jgi:hypothetical protein
MAQKCKYFKFNSIPRPPNVAHGESDIAQGEQIVLTVSNYPVVRTMVATFSTT